MSGRGSQAGPGPGGRTKSGKPRPGTGGYGKRKLEGKGPTPRATARPGHPAQRRASAAARGTDAPGTGTGTGSGPGTRDGGRGRGADWQGPGGAGQLGAGDSDAGRAPGRGRGGGPAGAGGAPGRGRGGGPAGAGRSAVISRGSGTATEIVVGRNAVLEALRAAVPATALHVGPRLDADERIGAAVMLAADARIPVVEAGRAELDRMTGGAIHQGLALRVRPYSYAHPDELVKAAYDAAAQPLIIALDGVTDPRNLGAVVRSAGAFGGHGVLVPVRRSAGVTAGAWKASAGALARVPVAQAPNLVRTLAAYQEAGLFVAGLDAGGTQDIAELELADGPLVLVIGSESKGLSRLVTQRCDVVVRIPITGTESLNAGIAAGIAMYQVARLRAG